MGAGNMQSYIAVGSLETKCARREQSRKQMGKQEGRLKCCKGGATCVGFSNSSWLRLAGLGVHKPLGAKVAQADLVHRLEREHGQDLLAVHILHQRRGAIVECHGGHHEAPAAGNLGQGHALVAGAHAADQQPEEDGEGEEEPAGDDVGVEGAEPEQEGLQGGGGQEERGSGCLAPVPKLTTS